MDPLDRVRRVALTQLMIVLALTVMGIAANPRLLRVVGVWLLPSLLNYYVSRTGNLRIVAILLNLVGTFFIGIIVYSFIDAPIGNLFRIVGMIACLGFAFLWLLEAALIGLLPRNAGQEPMYRPDDEGME